MDVIATKERRTNNLILIASNKRERHLLERAITAGTMSVEVVELSRAERTTFAVVVKFAASAGLPLHEEGA